MCSNRADPRKCPLEPLYRPPSGTPITAPSHPVPPAHCPWHLTAVILTCKSQAAFPTPHNQDDLKVGSQSLDVVPGGSLDLCGHTAHRCPVFSPAPRCYQLGVHRTCMSCWCFCSASGLTRVAIGLSVFRRQGSGIGAHAVPIPMVLTCHSHPPLGASSPLPGISLAPSLLHDFFRQIECEGHFRQEIPHVTVPFTSAPPLQGQVAPPAGIRVQECGRPLGRSCVQSKN